ncbi:MAG: glycosyltransferase [Leptolyngbya sp. SIO4C5]|nr:glycosyltransferase [Leptolyngbya sp. SIO4C5]
MPLVSVIVPVHNGAKTVRASLESVLRQTLTDFELIVIDDGSTDETLAVISELRDERLKLFSYPNAGVAASRNRGVSHSSGAYLSFLDADDLWVADKLAAQLTALQANPQAAIAYSWTNYIDQADRLIDRDRRVTLSGDVYAQLLVQNFLESGSNVMIRRQAFLAVGGFDESLHGPEDWDLLIRLAARYPFVAVAQLGILYRICGSSSVSANLPRQEAQTLRVINRSFEQAPDVLQPLKQKSLANFYQYLCFKAADGASGREKGQLAAHYYWQALKADWTVLTHRLGMTVRVFVKILAALALPPLVYQRLILLWRS